MTEGLVAADVVVELGGKTILTGSGFSAPRGKVTGLVGPNGAGKSTLIGTIAGLFKPARGMVRFDRNDLPGMGRRARAQLCAYVEQSSATEERLSVRDVVGLGRVPHASALAAESPEDRRIVDAAIARAGLGALADRQFNTLSGGEQQRAQIARGMAQAPELFLLDEPTSHLDIRAQIEVLALLAALAEDGKTVVLAIHDLNLALRHCDWLVAMEKGRVIAEGEPNEVLTPDLIGRLYGVRAHVVNAPGGSVLVFEGVT